MRAAPASAATSQAVSSGLPQLGSGCHTRAVIDRDDLRGKLASANDWVRDECIALSDVAFGLGCEAEPEGGAGVGFRLSGHFTVRLHPKREHIAVGLPVWMRLDVEALTHALREQRRTAWLN